VVVVALCTMLAACGGGGGSGVAATTSTTLGRYSPSEVLGWVTPTLDNGASFLSNVPATASPAQLLADAAPLHTAAVVSVRELGEITWTGALRPDERRLHKALQQLSSLTAGPAGTIDRARVQSSVDRARAALHDLTSAVAKHGGRSRS
jgi:hypothetical protein